MLERHQVPIYLVAGVLIGLAAPGTDDVFKALVYPVLGALLYATFLQVPFTAQRAAFADRRFLVAALGLNFPVVPAIVLAWATEAWAGRSVTGARFKGAVDRTPVALMALTLLVVVASQLPRVREDIDPRDRTARSGRGEGRWRLHLA